MSSNLIFIGMHSRIKLLYEFIVLTENAWNIYTNLVSIEFTDRVSVAEKLAFLIY